MLRYPVPVTVRVNPVPVVQPSVLNQTICNNENTSFLLTSPTNVAPLSFDYNVPPQAVLWVLQLPYRIIQ